MPALRLYALAVSGLWLGCACAGTTSAEIDVVPEDSGDVGYPGPFSIATVTPTCTEGDPDQWRYAVQTEGWAGGISLEIFETGHDSWPGSSESVWVETHQLGNASFDDQGTWDAYEIVLYAVSDTAMQATGATTAWDCSKNDAVQGVGGSLAWQLVMYNAAPIPEAVDCVIWGHQAKQYYEDQGGWTCRCIDEDNLCTN